MYSKTDLSCSFKLFSSSQQVLLIAGLVFKLGGCLRRFLDYSLQETNCSKNEHLKIDKSVVVFKSEHKSEKLSTVTASSAATHVMHLVTALLGMIDSTKFSSPNIILAGPPNRDMTCIVDLVSYTLIEPSSASSA